MKLKIEKIIAVLGITGITALSSSTALAGNNVADLNNDGMVTSEEVLTYVQMNFLKMDRDNDGMLNAKEAKELEEIFDIDG